jgi:hypothetical protein
VYWGNEAGEIWSVSKQGGDAIRLATGPQPANYICLDENYVYFTSGGTSNNDGRVSRLPKQGGDVTVISELGEYLHGLAVTNGRVYAGTGTGIHVFATDGAGPALIPGTSSVGNEIAADSDAIYWISDDGGVYRLLQ